MDPSIHDEEQTQTSAPTIAQAKATTRSARTSRSTRLACHRVSIYRKKQSATNSARAVPSPMPMSNCTAPPMKVAVAFGGGTVPVGAAAAPVLVTLEPL